MARKATETLLCYTNSWSPAHTATVVELDVLADRLDSARTLEHVPAFEFQFGAVNGDASPQIRVPGSDRRPIERALEAGPSVDVLANVS